MDQINQAPLISRLTRTSSPTLQQSDAERETIDRFLKKDLVYAPNPCLCGASDDLLLAERDRYCIPLQTYLCRQCGLMRSDPYLDKLSILHFYRTDYRDIHQSASAENLFLEEQWRGRQILRWIRQHRLEVPDQVFEIGCGTGGILDVFRSQGVRVAGCDLGDHYLEVGRSHGLTLESGGADSLIKYGQAKLLILSHVVEHLRNPPLEVKDMLTLLEPEGLVYIEVPGIMSIRQQYKSIDMYLQFAHVWHFTLQTLDYVMGMVGLQRVCGNQFIRSMYKIGESPGCQADRAAYREVLAYLKYTEHRRFVPRLSKLPEGLLPVARRILGEALYGFARDLYFRSVPPR